MIKVGLVAVAVTTTSAIIFNMNYLGAERHDSTGSNENILSSSTT